MFSGLMNLVLHPDRFFLRVSQEKVNLVPPFIIIGTGLFAILLSTILPLLFFSLDHPDRIGYVSWMGMLQFYLKCVVLIPLMIWATMSLGTFGISRVLGGKGSLAATARNTGFGMLPWTVGVLITIGISAVLFIIMQAVPSSRVPMEEYTQSLDALFPLASVVAIIWGEYLWILAVKYSHGFTFRKAAAVTVIPVLIVILLTVPVTVWNDTIVAFISGT